MRMQTHPSRAVSGPAANTSAAFPSAKQRNRLPDRPATSTQPFPANQKSASLALDYLIAPRCPLGAAINHAAPDPSSRAAESEVSAQIDMLAKKAREDLASPLVRLPALCEAFGLARSTALKKVARRELPQRVHFVNSRVSAYRKVDIEMTLAANALAARHGYVLNSAAFIAAISAPPDSTAQTN